MISSNLNDTGTFAVASFRQRRSLLSPVAYNELVMPSLRLTRSSRLARRIAKALLVLLFFTIVLVLFAPWQQSVNGSGNVVAYDPLQRTQTIEVPVKGRIVEWGKGIVENSHVTKGQMIAVIQDLDPNYYQQLQNQLSASEKQIAAARQQFDANERNFDALQTIIALYESQVAAYQDVRTQVIASADAMIEMARQKVTAEEQQLQENLASLAQAEADFLRQQQLYEEQIASQAKFQDAERKYKEAQAKVAKARSYVDAAKSELVAKQRDRDAKAQEAHIKIDSTDALLRKAQGDVAKADAEVAKAQAELTKAEKELVDMEVKVARQQRQTITAPFDGFVVQIGPNQGSRMVKEGDPLCVIVPDTEDRAVQLWLKGNDAPLVEPGRHVRLQFEGWPAVQFTGWPSVAVGTFGGTVVSVDAKDDDKGRFRVLVRPDASDQQWPSGRFLRQGVRANGWVLLNRVPLWFEVWRRLNAFPPTVSFDNETKVDSKSKPPKVGK